MSKCHACNAEIIFAINLDTNKRVPLVKFDPSVAKPVRYRLSDDNKYCARDDDGDWISHFQNCPGAKRFSGRNRGK